MTSGRPVRGVDGNAAADHPRHTSAQLGVRRLLLIQIGGEETHDLVVAELLGPGYQRPIAANFIVLEGLSGGDDGGIEYGLILDLASDLVGLLDDSVEGRTMRPAGFLAEFFERLLKPLDLLVGLFEMTFQPSDQVTVGRLLDHLGQRFDDLLLSIDVLQTMDQQILNRLYPW